MWQNTANKGRGRNDFTSGTPDQHPTFYPQSSSTARRGGHPQNFQFQNKIRRGRARPPNQRPYYGDHPNLVSTFQMLPPHGRGGGGNIPGGARGGSLIDSFLPPPRPSSRRSYTESGRFRHENNTMEGRNEQDQRTEGSMSHGVSLESVRIDQRSRIPSNEGMIWPDMYLCPKCVNTYQLCYFHNKYVGKLPLVLDCGHTMCQECIYQGLKNNKVNCAKCHFDSTLTQDQTPVCPTDIQNIFQPNYHILGVMSYHKASENRLRNLDSVGFLSQTSKKSSQSAVDLSERCCFSSCTKTATLYCPSCEGIYCSECSTVVHKSAKNLMSHQPVPRITHKFTLMLENCNQHPAMPVEFFCKICDLSACCYCVLNQHADHERVSLYELNKVEMEEFRTLQENVGPVLKNLLTAQKKASRLTNFDTTPIKKQVSDYFTYFYGQLQVLESKLCEDLEQFKASNHGLDVIEASLKTSAEQLKQLLSLDLDKLGDNKLNLRLALVKLRKLHETPRFLLNKDGQSYPIRFVADNDLVTDLSHRIALEKCEDSEYHLVTERELPEGYVAEDESDEEVSAILSQPDRQLAVTLTDSSVNSQASRFRKAPPKKKPDMAKVEVQHVNSMDSFYVHFKKDQQRLAQLSKDIDNYVKMGGAEAVETPELNEVYLMLYINKSPNKMEEQMWCRARLQEIHNKEPEPLYDMFLIDYGKSQLVKKNRIRDIPPSLRQKKSFAVECMLHNPMNANWNDKAHYALAKILNGKEVFLLEKSVKQGVHEVDLMIASSDGGMTSIIDILVYAHHAVDPLDNMSISDGTLSKQINYNNLVVFPNSQKFAKNQKEKVIIANIVDPHNIFIHMLQHQDAFRTMCRAIKKTFKTSKCGDCIPIEGTYVLVEYKDPVRTNFHRAFVKSVDLEAEKVHVLLVDWGLNVVVTTHCIRPLEESLTRLESQAVLVKLAHIAPYNKRMMWSRVSSEFLQKYFVSQDVLKMMVHDVERDIQVALFDCSKNVDICINALMVENNYADSTGPISTKVNWPQYELCNREFKEGEDLMSLLLKKVIDSANDESDEDDVPEINKKKIEVVKVKSPSEIWIKFLECQDKEREMVTGLQAHYSVQTPIKSKWAIGEPCVAELNEQFCRGKVLQVGDGECRIMFIDKIVEETVPFDKLYVQVKFFNQFLQFVKKCHLANILPAGDTGKWSISSIEALQELCSKNHSLYAAETTDSFSLEFSEKSIPIDMWYGLVIRGGALDPDRIKYISINNSLAKLGYAYKAPRIKKANNGEDLLKGLVKEPKNIAEPDQRETEDEKHKIAPQMVIESESGASASDIDAIEYLSLEDQAVTEIDKEKATSEKNIEEVKDWNEIIALEQSDDRSVEADKGEDVVEVAMTDWLPPFRLLNSDFQARVTCVETGGHMYVRDQTIDQGYQNVEGNIKKFFESNQPDWTEHEWAVGDLCTIKYTDGNWYRGKVIKVISRDLINVLMIDFGSDHNVPPSALYRQLLYTEIPAFATKVKLDKIYSRSGSWLTSDYDHFHSLVSDWCRIVVQGPKEVELPLVEVYNDAGVCVNSKLIELCPNLSRCANFPVKASEEEEEEDDMPVIETIEPVLNLDLLRTVDQSNYEVLPLPQELLEGQQVLMEIGGVFSFRSITVRSPLVDPSAEMTNMINEIQDFVSNFPPLTDFQVGTPCLAPFSEDDVYYRGRIIDLEGAKAGLVHVLFVDYGNHESVPINETKVIPLRYLQLPQQCWEVYLNIEPTNENSDLTSITQFINSLDRRRKHIKLVKEDPLTVDIYHKNGNLCYAQFLKNGNVKPIDQEL